MRGTVSRAYLTSVFSAFEVAEIYAISKKRSAEKHAVKIRVRISRELEAKIVQLKIKT
jgi:hypothetical protein